MIKSAGGANLTAHTPCKIKIKTMQRYAGSPKLGKKSDRKHGNLTFSLGGKFRRVGKAPRLKEELPPQIEEALKALPTEEPGVQPEEVKPEEVAPAAIPPEADHGTSSPMAGESFRLKVFKTSATEGSPSPGGRWASLEEIASDPCNIVAFSFRKGNTMKLHYFATGTWPQLEVWIKETRHPGGVTYRRTETFGCYDGVPLRMEFVERNGTLCGIARTWQADGTLSEMDYYKNGTLVATASWQPCNQ